MFKKISIGSLALLGFFTVNKASESLSEKIDKLPKALPDSKDYHKFKLISKDNVTHDTRLFRFELPEKTNILGILPGQHVVIKAKLDDKFVFRPYSPTSKIDEKGHFDLTIKVYQSNAKFPNGGVMSKYLDSIKIGDKIDFAGPVGRCRYFGNGEFGFVYEKDTPEVKKTYKKYGFIAGGTGLTPLYQIGKNICEEKNNENEIKLIFSNHTEKDILLHNELNELEKKYPKKFSVWHTISKSVEPNWKYDLGHVNEEMFKKHLPPPSKETLILVCGPPDFVKLTCVPILLKMGYAEENIFKY